MGWDDVGSYASAAYLLMPEEAADPALRTRMANGIINVCEGIMAAYAGEPYMISLGNSYPWGSNMTVANNAVLLLFGSMIKADPSYAEAAMEHVHYLFGRNALSQSYVTGFGAKPVKNPHHRPSEAAGEAVPGMVAGGPNGNLEDPFAAAMLKDLPPQKCYADAEPSYSTNEVTIYWNSPVYLLLTMLGLD
jgi:endoglucanase